jgi:prepilin-type N-terminal cleavage/methylation domain-containing protein
MRLWVHVGNHRAAGFTLLEAIVALAIIGAVLIPLAGFITQSADQLERAADANERSFAMQSALALIDVVNPMEEPQGQLPLDEEITISWQSQEMIPPNDGVMVGAGLAAFRLGFYNVRISLSKTDTGPWFDFETRKVGYQRLTGTMPLSSGTLKPNR